MNSSIINFTIVAFFGKQTDVIVFYGEAGGNAAIEKPNCCIPEGKLLPDPYDASVKVEVLK